VRPPQRAAHRGHIEVAEDESGFSSPAQFFCSDLSEEEEQIVFATAMPPVPDLFNQKVEGVAWKTKPSWAIVGKKDETVQPSLSATRPRGMGPKAFELESNHVPMLPQPKNVLDIIRQAAESP
jgi:hypothetical protein